MARSIRDLLGPAAVFLAIATLLAIPVMRSAPLVQDSFWIDYVWTERFHAALAAGHPYPRWLEGSFDGLGAPVFYFYAPLAFYATSLAMFLGLGPYAALLATFVGFHALSGVTMHRWLGARGRAALAGALLYMLLPYHLLDFSRRGALAEFAAYALLPLVALGVDRIATRRGIVPLAFAFAGLVLTHLPTALLASVLVLLPMMSRKLRDRSAAWVAVALGLGLGLASVYLVPALTLQAHTNMASMWGNPGYHPASWSLLSPQRWPSKASGTLFAGLEIALAMAALAMWRRRAAFWPGLAFFACLIAADLVPGFWSIPMLDKVQFPWRSLTIAEFAVATAFAHWSRDPDRSPRAIYLLSPALILSVAMIVAPFSIGHPTLAELDRTRPEVIEYLPDATAVRTGEQAAALARTTPDNAESGGWSVRRRFWFPSVVLRCNGQVVDSFAQPGTGLVMYRTAAGCVPTVATGTTSAEKIGWLLSLASLTVLLGFVLHAAIARRIARDEQAGPRPHPNR